MKKIELIQSIKQQDLILANAVSKMVDYIQDKWAAPYPSKEQTEAVNDYLRSVHANGDGTMNETAIAHRKIALTALYFFRLFPGKHLGKFHARHP